MYAKYYQGDTLMVDYTPSGAVGAGDVVVINGLAHIAHVDIAANVLGSLAKPAGGAVYDVVKDSSTFADSVNVYWDATNHVATSTIIGNSFLGISVGSAVTGAATVRVQHIGQARGSGSSVAATGSVQGDAASVGAGFNLVTAADATKGVILLSSSRSVEIKNSDAANAVLKVYPPTGGTINALSANAAISMAAKTAATFRSSDGVAFYTFPLLPS